MNSLFFFVWLVAVFLWRHWLWWLVELLLYFLLLYFWWLRRYWLCLDYKTMSKFFNALSVFSLLYVFQAQVYLKIKGERVVEDKHNWHHLYVLLPFCVLFFVPSSNSPLNIEREKSFYFCEKQEKYYEYINYNPVI